MLIRRCFCWIVAGVGAGSVALSCSSTDRDYSGPSAAGAGEGGTAADSAPDAGGERSHPGSGGETGGASQLGAEGGMTTGAGGALVPEGGSGPASCEGTALDCDDSGECATDGATDAQHCGDCETSCAQQCRAGVCADPIKVSVGFTHACALLSDGSVWCWGSNYWGELGPGHADGATAPVLVALPQRAIDVAAGGASQETGNPLAVSCAVLEDKTVRCWGAGAAGGLGNGLTTSGGTPVVVKGVANATHISLGGGHGCAVTGVGKLYCWGRNDEGQVGNGAKADVATPISVLSSAKQVAAGGRHTCALQSNGSVWCWGRSNSGQLGVANLPQSTASPIEVPGMNDSAEVATGGSHSCARRGTTVYCWGSDYSGAVNATFSNVETPVQVDIDDNPPPAKSLALGADISSVIGSDDLLTVWGATFHGDGQGSTGYAPAQIDVGAVLQASFGQNNNDEHTVCVIKANRQLLCWGGDSQGQVGNGDPVAEVTMPAIVKFVD